MSGQFPMSNWLSDKLNSTTRDATTPDLRPERSMGPSVVHLNQHDLNLGLNIDQDSGPSSLPNFVNQTLVPPSCLPERQGTQATDASFERIPPEELMQPHLACNICGEYFSSQGRLNTHNRRHERRHHCIQCGRQFSESRDLRRHIESVHDKLCDACPFCGKTLKRRRDNWQRHMRRHDNNQGHSSSR